MVKYIHVFLVYIKIKYTSYNMYNTKYYNVSKQICMVKDTHVFLAYIKIKYVKYYRVVLTINMMDSVFRSYSNIPAVISYVISDVCILLKVLSRSLHHA